MKIVRLKTTDEKKILTILDRGRGVLSLVSIVVEAVSSLELRSLNQIYAPNLANQSRDWRSKEPTAKNVRIDHAQRGKTQAIKSLVERIDQLANQKAYGCKPKETRDFIPQ